MARRVGPQGVDYVICQSEGSAEKKFSSPESCSLVERNAKKESALKHHIFRSHSSRLKTFQEIQRSWERITKKARKSRKWMWKLSSDRTFLKVAGVGLSALRDL